MKSKRFEDTIGGDIERILLSGNRRAYPGVEIVYLKEEGWAQGRVYISISRDSEAMTIDQFEIFIAMFRTIIVVARRKEEELKACPSDAAVMGDMPQVEMNYDSAMTNSENVMFVINDMGGTFSCSTAESFLTLMENLLEKGREINKFAA